MGVAAQPMVPIEAGRRWPSFTRSWAGQYRGTWRQSFDLMASVRPTDRDRTVAWIALRDGDAVGGLHLLGPNASLPPWVRVGWIANVWVLPSCRGCGVASALVSEAIRGSAGEVTAGFGLTTDRAGSAASSNIYARLGFVAVGQGSTLMFFEGDATNAHRDGGKLLDPTRLERSDTGVIAAIAGRRHELRIGTSWKADQVGDPEELVVRILATNSDLGYVGSVGPSLPGGLYWIRRTAVGEVELRVQSVQGLGLLNPSPWRSEAIAAACLAAGADPWTR
jgi:GNAT superfamily N-acetyltransferase